jgi:hypothetical protein
MRPTRLPVVPQISVLLPPATASRPGKERWSFRTPESAVCGGRASRVLKDLNVLPQYPLERGNPTVTPCEVRVSRRMASDAPDEPTSSAQMRGRMR